MKENPIELFKEWFEKARESESELSEAVALATASATGVPSVRMVLLKQVDERGFVFYTNLGSQKATDLALNPNAELCFHWKSLGRQVRVGGQVKLVSSDEADAYFASRDRASQLGAWASRQSDVMGGRFELERAVAKFTAKFALGKVPRPEWWSGFRLDPTTIELWEQLPFRLHRRKLFTRDDTGWTWAWLYP